MEGNTNISKTNQTNNPIMNSIQDVIFRNDNVNFFIFKKTERIVTALYIISEFLSDMEPSKFAIKDIANNLLKQALNLSNRNPDHDEFSIGLLKCFANISLLVNLIRDLGKISDMNADILLDEVSGIADIITKKWSKSGSQAKTLSSEFFAVGIDMKEDEYSNNPFRKGLSKIYPVDIRGRHIGIKDNLKDNVLYDNSEKMSVSRHNPVKDKDNRQEIIISLLKKNKSLTIKDFSAHIKGCSEKTIQRELIALMSKNVLKKEGERRWSKYSLK